MKKRYLDCLCSSPEHVIRFSWDANETNPEFQELYVEVQARPYLGFFRRVWVAFKFMFNLGEIGWADAMLSEKEVLDLRAIVDEYLVEMRMLRESKDTTESDKLLKILKKAYEDPSILNIKG